MSKFAVVLSLAVLATLLLSACTATVQAPAAATKAAEAAAKPAGGQITADYMQSGTYDKAAEELKSEFEKKTGIKVELVAQPWETLNQNNITDLTTGTGAYDVMSGEFWIANVFDKMLPLDDYVNRDGFGKDYVDRIWSPGPSNFYDGKRIGVPYSADAYGIWYRTDLFDKCGIKADWKTWDDYIARLDTLQKCLEGTDIAPMVHYFGAPEQPLALFLGMYDGYLVDKDGKYGVDREKAVAALNKLQGLLKYNPKDALSLGINDGNAVFLNGKAATMVGWPSFIRAAADDPQKSQVVGKWALAPFPGPGFPMVSAWNMFISKDSKNPDAAWEWIKAYANADNAKKWMDKYGIGSPFKSTYEDADLVKKFPYFYPAQGENLNKAKSLPLTFDAFQAFFQQEGNFHQGKITAEQMLDNVQKQWDEMKVPPALVQLAEAQGLKQK